MNRHTYEQKGRNVDRQMIGQRCRTKHRGTYRKMHKWRERWTETVADTVSISFSIFLFFFQLVSLSSLGIPNKLGACSVGHTNNEWMVHVSE